MFIESVKFLFQCQTCKLIVSLELEDEEDILNVREDKMILDCPCGGKCVPLRDFILEI